MDDEQKRAAGGVVVPREIDRSSVLLVWNAA